MGSRVVDPRPRRLRQIGMACLVFGLLPHFLDLSFGLRPVPLHFVSGVLLGVSIATNVAALRQSCRRLTLPEA